MGQSYKVVNIDKRESLDVIGFGWKLMEHSWIGNDTVLAVADLLTSGWRGDRVVWAGEYADEDDEPFHDHQDGNLYQQEYPSPAVEPEYGHGIRFFVNVDKRQYVDLEDVLEETNGWKIHPLPLLLATSNGQGGGDYANRPGMPLVGSWKGDHIQAYEADDSFEIDRLLFDWERVEPGFTERVPDLPRGLTFEEVPISEERLDFQYAYNIWYKGSLVNHIAHGSTDTTLITPFTTSREHNYYLPTRYIIIDALQAGVERLRLEGVRRWVEQWNEIPTEAVTYLARELGYKTLAGDEESHYSEDLVAWGEMWTFKNHTDETWASKNPDAFERAGISLFDVEKVGLVFGVDGGGYSFLEDHFLPLYIERGLRWHPVDPELERALEDWHPVEA